MDTTQTAHAAHAALPDPSRLPSRVTNAQIGLVVEIGPAFFMAETPPYAGNGSLRPDDVTGLRGEICHVAAPDGGYQDVKIWTRGGGMWITTHRLRVVQPDGTAAPSAQERGFPTYQRTGIFPR